MNPYPFELDWKKYEGGTRERWVAFDSGTGIRYTIEQVNPGDDSKWALTWVNEEEVNENGNFDVHQHGTYRTWSEAKHAAWVNREGVREDRAARTVLEFQHPDDDSVLYVFTNGYSRITDITFNDGGTPQTIRDLDREHVQALYEALGRVVEVQNEARAKRAS